MSTAAVDLGVSAMDGGLSKLKKTKQKNRSGYHESNLRQQKQAKCAQFTAYFHFGVDRALPAPPPCVLSQRVPGPHL